MIEGVGEEVVRVLGWSFPDPALERPGDLIALQESLEPIAAETAMARAEGLVSDAFAALLEHGLPFLEALAREHP